MSLRKAIDNMCKTCIYDENSGGGTWREQVAQCTAHKCPLFDVRPLPGSGPWSKHGSAYIAHSMVQNGASVDE